jgi:predicted Kef-type K+ transport protein
MELPVALFMWAIGATFGGLCVSSSERGEHDDENAQRYRLYMAYFYFVALVMMASSSILGADGRAVLLLGGFAVAFFVAVVVAETALRRASR